MQDNTKDKIKFKIVSPWLMFSWKTLVEVSCRNFFKWSLWPPAYLLMMNIWNYSARWKL